MRYIASNPASNPALKNNVFKDSLLTLDMAVAKRKLDTARDPNTLVFSVQNPQELGGLLTSLNSIRAGQGGRPVPTLISQGYTDRSGAPQGNFRAALNSQPRIEVIVSMGGGNHVVVVLDNNGVAYVDPTGAAPPQDMEGLYKYWPLFYDKPGDDAAKDQLARQNVHLHKDIKQTEKTSDSLDWCLTNLDTLATNIHADATRLKSGRKIDRNGLVGAINGQQIPSDPRNTFALTYVDESINERQKRERIRQLEQARERHKKVHRDANHLWRQANERGELPTLHTDPNLAWVEVFISVPPEYTEGDDINQYNTTHANGVKNTFEIKESGNLAVKSTGGKVSYKERFTRLAEDTAAALADDTMRLPDQLVLNKIDPPEEEEKCIAAFEKIFGKGNVIFRPADADRNDEPDSSFSARPIR